MLRATAITRKLAVKADKVVDTVELDHEARHRRRATLTGTGGTQVLLDLEKATALKDGDALRLEDGRLVQVKAAPEKLLEIRSENTLRLLKVAWHIGNRHTPAEMTAEALYIAEDHVLEEMVRGLGVAIAHVERPFEPERGAYEGHGHGHHHDHHHHDHDHHDHHHHDHHGHDHAGHGHEAHGHAAHGRDTLAVASAGAAVGDHAHAHSHGEDCGCEAHGHDHDHKHGGHGHHHDHKHG